ncbi:MAG TPA: helix-hairpin-helix domain-containing protein, partial [Propionicimonas sp.]
LPFERFLSALRDEEPDIDVDFDADRREEIIQWVFDRYGRERAAQVCNVIQYRPKNAIRDISRALGYSPGQGDAFARQVEGWAASVTPEPSSGSGNGGNSSGNGGNSSGSGSGDGIPEAVIELTTQLLKAPRHLGIHSAGMVLTERPVGEVVPIEHARMDNRTVIQWDKDDAAWMGLVKFDLLGLGMLAALQHCFDLARESTGETWDLATLPKEEAAVYDMLCRADSIGVFQVESRAQMGLLPRLQPRRFYDLVIQIALIRPGPIQGGAVHPFVRRKLGKEEVTYPHPKLEAVLKRTLGIPVFQEQLMQMAMAVGDCTGEDADLLRRAMGSKRGLERIESLKRKLYEGMARNGLVGAEADHLYAQIQAFSNFGFAESHSLSFALLVYASSWMKLHYPAAFLAGLLRAQPMGFYSASTLVSDARRHGVVVLRPDLSLSGVDAGLESTAPEPEGPTGLDACRNRRQPPVADFDVSLPDEYEAHRRDGDFAVRLGLAGVRGIGKGVAERIVTEREARGSYRSMEDLVRRTGLTTEHLEALAASGALECLGLTRRQALWRAGSAALDQPGSLPGTLVESQPLLFDDPTPVEVLADDLWATGVSTEDHPIAQLRAELDARGVLSTARLAT